MKKNNKGYLLTETLIVITVVATIITMVYAVIVNYYVKQENEVTKFNTSEGLYIASQIEKYFSGIESDFINSSSFTSNGYLDLTGQYQIYNIGFDNSNLSNSLEIKKIYFAENNLSSLLNDTTLKFTTVIKKNLEENSDTDENSCEYRYLIIFKDNSYATTGIFCDE